MYLVLLTAYIPTSFLQLLPVCRYLPRLVWAHRLQTLIHWQKFLISFNVKLLIFTQLRLFRKDLFRRNWESKSWTANKCFDPTLLAVLLGCYSCLNVIVCNSWDKVWSPIACNTNTTYFFNGGGGGGGEFQYNNGGRKKIMHYQKPIEGLWEGKETQLP